MITLLISWKKKEVCPMFIVKRRMISTGMDIGQRLLITMMILTKRELDMTLCP